MKKYISEMIGTMVLVLMAPLFKKTKRCKSLNFKEVRGFFFSKSKQNQWD